MSYKEQYIKDMWEEIKEVNLKGSHLFVVIAQGAVESNWGALIWQQNIIITLVLRQVASGQASKNLCNKL
jgi:hypothetical protein